MDTFSQLFEKKSEKKVGICLEWELPQLTENLKTLSDQYHLITYGTRIDGIDFAAYSEDPSMDLIQDFKSGKIDGFVRGINDDYTFQRKFKKELNFKRMMRLAFMKDAHGREFCLGPISASEAVDYEDRLQFTIRTVNFIKKMGVTPSVAVMSACRPGSVNYSESNHESWMESDKIVEKLQEMGIEAKNVGIEIEKSVGNYNVILPVRGIIGNQIFRTLTFLGKGEVLGIPAFDINNPLLCYEDNSRNEVDYECHIKAALLWADLQ